MPLDWDAVKRRYEDGAAVPTVAGNKTLEVTGADDEAIYIRGGRLWTAALERGHLELAAELIDGASSAAARSPSWRGTTSASPPSAGPRWRTS